MRLPTRRTPRRGPARPAAARAHLGVDRTAVARAAVARTAVARTAVDRTAVARTAVARFAPVLTAAFLALSLAAPSPLAAQVEEDRLRVGLTLGGTGFLALVTEYERSAWSLELSLGTISFREISVAITGKRYFLDGRARPAIGLGLWSLTAWTEDGSGSVLVARLPVALDWTVSGGHALGLEIGLNRALAVNRLDPEDDTPPNRTIVPFPGFYYRHAWSP